MAVSSGIQIDGLEDLQELFDGLILKEAQNLNRAAVHAIATQIAKDARSRAPVDTGGMRKAIKAHRRRSRDPNSPYSDVRVGRDFFYWRFIEYGTKGDSEKNMPAQPARPFFLPAIAAARTNIKSIYREMVWKKLAQKLKREARKGKK